MDTKVERRRGATYRAMPEPLPGRSGQRCRRDAGTARPAWRNRPDAGPAGGPGADADTAAV